MSHSIKGNNTLLTQPFDYNTWQRTSIVPTANSPVQPAAESKSDQGLKANNYIVTAPKESRCSHGRKPVKLKPVTSTAKKSDKLKLLQLQLKTRKNTLEQLKERQDQIMKNNMSLLKEMEHNEEEAHQKVKSLLRKYEKFMGSINTLTENFKKDLADSQKDLENEKLRIETEQKALEADVEEVDKRLSEEQTQLSTLTTYKDKEYPLKALRITSLQKEIEQLAVQNTEDEMEIKRIVDMEINKLHKRRAETNAKLNEAAVDLAIATVHPSVRQMAMHNATLTQEIQYHEREMEEVGEINKTLKREIRKLLIDSKTNIRQQMFPEFYVTDKKCTPDMDVVLDIPKQSWLPI